MQSEMQTTMMFSVLLLGWFILYSATALPQESQDKPKKAAPDLASADLKRLTR
ncbi:hypothetical protein L0337_44515 [candidate division KSB1 bacterium]|nr:hypothetical protein [candidate division KSB1 bacterium]